MRSGIVEWTAADGSTPGAMRWMPNDDPRAWVVALHGLNCTALDWQPLATPLTEAGVALAAWNLRGQGRDPVTTRRGAWLEIEGMLADLEAFVSSLTLGGKPLFLAGDSMGALVAIQAAAAGRMPFEGLIVFVPVVELAQKNPPWVKATMRAAAAGLPRLRLNPGWFVHGRASTPKLTRIASRQAEFEAAPHRIRAFTVGFLLAMGDLIETAVPLAQKLDLPVALFSAGRDPFVTADATERFFRAIASPDKTHFHYPEGHHQLLHDLDAARVAADATVWIAERLPREA